MIGNQCSDHPVGIGNSIPVAFSILDINATIINGISCERCGDLAWNTSRTLSPHLRKPEGHSSPSPENVILTSKALRIISNFARIVAKEHTEH
jgi:hypothetical protein